MTRRSNLATPDNDDETLSDDEFSVSGLESGEQLPSGRLPADLGSHLRGFWRFGGVVAFVTLFAIVAIAVAPHLPRYTPARVAPQYTALQVSSNIARCLMAASWSHDGREIAAAQSFACSSPYLGPNTSPGNLLIFDASTGKQVAAYTLDTAVDAAIAKEKVSAGGDSLNEIQYYQTIWSPGGRVMAVGFSVYGAQVARSGMAFVTLTGPKRGQVNVTLLAPDAGDGYPGNGFDAFPVERWDVTTGTYTTIYLAPALAYHWLPSDVLVADEPLAPNVSAPVEPATPPGDPSGGRSFSLWSIGVLSPVNALSCGSNGVTIQPLLTPYANLALGAIAWSPDGRYLLEPSIQARLPTIAGHPLTSASGSQPCDSGLAPDQLASAPMHDNGLRTALGLLDPQGGNQLTLAWSPDGRHLAVETFAFAQNSGEVAVYDCSSGAALQYFTGDLFVPAPSVAESAQNPVWSPDSAHLLLSISGPEAKLVVVGPHSLGA